MRDKNYQWNAEDYAKHSEGQFRFASELIEKLGLEGHESLLDIGCGDGKVTAVLAERLPRGSVLGVDSSADMIDLARRTHGANGRENLGFEIMDARELRFDRLFDVAFSSAALHWVTDQRAVLRGVKRSLRRGGRLLFQMGGKGNFAEVFASMDRVITTAPWWAWFKDFDFPYSFLDDATYRHLLLEAGLEPVRVELIRREMVHDGAEGLASWVRTTWLPYAERVPGGMWETLVNAMVEDYLRDHPVGADGKARIAAVRLEAEAVNP